MSKNIHSTPCGRKVLEEMDVSVAELAGRCGLASGTVSEVLSGRKTSLKCRIKIEAALGEPIWSTWSEFLVRGKQAKILGGEPGALTMKQLRAAAKRYGLRNFSTLNMEQLTSEILNAAEELQKRESLDKQQLKETLDRFVSADQWQCQNCQHRFERKSSRRIPQRCPECRSASIWP